MTMTTHPYDPLTWKQADADVHVATRDGEYAGFVEFDGDVHLVRDAHGTDVGSFPTLDGAREALAEAQVEDPRPFRRSIPLPRILRRHLRRVRA